MSSLNKEAFHIDPSAHFVSTFFTLEEVNFSDIAQRHQIVNKIPDYLLPNAIEVAEMMDEVRTLIHFPIHVNSWYRCLELNRLVGSKDHSQHPKGESVDWTCRRYGSPLEICRRIVDSSIEFDQLILEHSWIHMSKRRITNGLNRKNVLTLNLNPITKHSQPYLSGLIDMSQFRYD